MFSHIRRLTLVVVLATLLVGSAVAAPNGTATPGNATVQIDQQTELLDSTYDAENGTLTVILRADRAQSVTVSDAGALADGSGEIPTRTTVLEADQPTRVTLDVTPIDGRVGVTVSTGNTLYGHVIRIASDDSLFQGRPTWQDMQVAGLSGFVGGLLVVALVAYHRVKSDQGEVERVL